MPHGTSRWKPSSAKVPVHRRVPDEQSIRERATFLAFEIHHDRLAPEQEIADAIDAEIRRFARDRYLL